MDESVAIESSEQPLDLVAKLVEFAVVVPFEFPVRFRRLDWRYPQGLSTRRMVSSRSQVRPIARGGFATGSFQLSSSATGLLAELGLEAALELGYCVGLDCAETQSVTAV